MYKDLCTGYKDLFKCYGEAGCCAIKPEGSEKTYEKPWRKPLRLSLTEAR